MLASLAASIAATFAPWGTSGSVGRNSYELVDSGRTLDLLDDRLLDVAVVWFGLPIVAASAVVALLFRRVIVGTVMSTSVGALLVFGWMSVKSSPLAVDTGATAGAVIGAATIAASGVLLWTHHFDQRDTRRASRIPEQPRTAATPVDI